MKVTLICEIKKNLSPSKPREKNIASSVKRVSSKLKEKKTHVLFYLQKKSRARKIKKKIIIKNRKESDVKWKMPREKKENEKVGKETAWIFSRWRKWRGKVEKNDKNHGQTKTKKCICRKIKWEKKVHICFWNGFVRIREEEIPGLTCSPGIQGCLFRFCVILGIRRHCLFRSKLQMSFFSLFALNYFSLIIEVIYFNFLFILMVAGFFDGFFIFIILKLVKGFSWFLCFLDWRIYFIVRNFVFLIMHFVGKVNYYIWFV